MQADRSDRSGAQTRVDTAVATLVKHWSGVMPKGNLTAGALKHLLEQRDNKLFDGITALCVSSHVPSIFPPGMQPLFSYNSPVSGPSIVFSMVACAL